MTSQVVEGRCICTDSFYGQLRGDWVNQKTSKLPFADFFPLILHKMARFRCFVLKNGFFSKSLVLYFTHLPLEILPKNMF